MRFTYMLTIAILASSACHGQSEGEHAQGPQLLNNTWHVYTCKDLPQGSNDKPGNCTDEDQLARESFIHIEQAHGSAVIVSMKLPQHDDLQVFSGTLEDVERVEEMETERMIRFFDDAQGQKLGKYKRLYLQLARTDVSDSIGDEPCEDLLDDYARGKDVFSDEDKKICQSKSDQDRKLNVIYWRIAPDVDLGEGSAGVQIPPGDGQGSGSDEPPR